MIFEVDYLDSELGRKLAALAEAVRSGDRIAASSSAKVASNYCFHYIIFNIDGAGS